MRSFIIETSDQRSRLFSFLNARELPFQVEYGQVKEVRSLPANKRLWKLHSLAAAVTGMSAEEMHEEALCRFFGFVEKKMPSGWIKRIPIERSSTKDPKKFGEFMESTEAWYIQDFGVWLGQDE